MLGSDFKGSPAGAAPAAEKAQKVKQVNADISGADRKEIIKSLDDKMAKTVSQVSQHYSY